MRVGHGNERCCRLRLGNPAAAIPYFRRATEIDPGHEDARSNLAQLEFALSQQK